MSDGRNTLKKIAFQLGNRWFRFAINPENYVHRKPHRATAIKTKSRIVIEDFQSDIPTISIRGTTGFNPTGRAKDRGIAKIKEMKQFLERYAEMGGNGGLPPEDFYFHNFTNDESFVIHLSPDGVEFTQDANEPLLFRYEITFNVLRKANQPAEDDIVDPEIGNRFPSIPKGPGGPRDPFPMNPHGPTPSRNTANPPGNDSVYTSQPQNNRSEYYRDTVENEPINPQAPSHISYFRGTTGLGYTIGYYGRTY